MTGIRNNFKEEIKRYIKDNGNRYLDFKDFARIMINLSGEDGYDKNANNRFVTKYFSDSNSLVATIGTRKQRQIALDQAILFNYLISSNTDTLDVETVALLFENI